MCIELELVDSAVHEERALRMHGWRCTDILGLDTNAVPLGPDCSVEYKSQRCEISIAPLSVHNCAAASNSLTT